jgi:hypothetical protein
MDMGRSLKAFSREARSVISGRAGFFLLAFSYAGDWRAKENPELAFCLQILCSSDLLTDALAAERSQKTNVPRSARLTENKVSRAHIYSGLWIFTSEHIPSLVIEDDGTEFERLTSQEIGHGKSDG